MLQRGFKFSLLVAAASAALLTLPSSHARAAEEPKNQFHPIHAWEVLPQKGATSVNTGAGLCSIQNEFNNHFIVRFDGANNWVESLNIDFRQDIFEIGKAYDVSLSAPGIKNKVLKGKASQEGALSIRMKGEKELYQAISQSSVLDLKIEDNYFRFYLVGFSAAAKNLERCMVGTPAPLAPSEKLPVREALNGAPPPPENSFVNESIAYEQAEIKDVPVTEILPPLPETHIEILSAETGSGAAGKAAASSTAPKPYKRLSESLAEEIKKNPDIISTDTMRPTSSQEKLAFEEKQSVRKPLAIPPEKIKEVDLLPPPDSALASVTPPEPEALAQANIEVEATRPPAPKTEVIHYESPRVQVKKEVIKSQIDLTSAGLDNVEPSSAPDTGFSTANRGDADLLETISKLEADLQAVKQENSALNDELKSSLKESEHERLSISSENWNLERATMRFNEAERQIKNLGRQIQKERAQCTLEKKDLEGMLFDPQVTDQAQLGRLSALEKKVMDTEREMELQRQRYEEQIRLLKNSTTAQ